MLMNSIYLMKGVIKVFTQLIMTESIDKFSKLKLIYAVHSISFQTFFVQAFTIAVNSRYFSELTNFFLFRCKFIATAEIRVHLTKS